MSKGRSHTAIKVQDLTPRRKLPFGGHVTPAARILLCSPDNRYQLLRGSQVTPAGSLLCYAHAGTFCTHDQCKKGLFALMLARRASSAHTHTKKKFSFRSFLRFCNSIFIISFRSFRSLSLFLQSFAFRDKTSGKRLQTKQQVFAEQVTGVRGKRQKQQASADKTKQQVFADKFDLSFAI
jgi:hypothetical protein